MSCVGAILEDKKQLLTQDDYDACQTVLEKPDARSHLRRQILNAVLIIHHDANPSSGNPKRRMNDTQDGIWAPEGHLSTTYGKFYDPRSTNHATSADLFVTASRDPIHIGSTSNHTYFLGDRISHTDPSDHHCIFGLDLTGRDVAMAITSAGISVIVGILTGSTSVAVQFSLSFAAAIASDVAMGAIYDVSNGKKPTLETVGTDALNGAIGGLAGEVVGEGIVKGFKILFWRIRGLGRMMKWFFGIWVAF